MMYLLGLAIFLVACSPKTGTESAPVVIPTSTNTPVQLTITPSPTTTNSPTPELPVSLNTPIPEQNTKIVTANLISLTELGRYYGNISYIARLSQDGSLLFIRNQASLDVYDYPSKKLKIRINHYAIQSSDFGLQISQDGRWALIDGEWLLNVNTGSTKNDLVNVFTLVGFKEHNNPIPLTALSADGSKLAIAEFYQRGRFYIIDTESGQIITKSIFGSTPVFSPDGSIIATNMDNQLILWNIADGKQIEKYPKGTVVFSGDATLIAIRQSSGAIDLWERAIGEKTATIQLNSNQCSIPVFSQDNKKIALFDCNGNVQVWSIQGTLLSDKHYESDVPSILFNESGEVSLLGTPYVVGRWRGYEGYQMYDFQFQGNETIYFQYHDSHRRSRHGCTISLRSSDQDCKNNLILGTDNNYYNYVVDGKTLNIFSYPSPIGSKPLYQINWLGSSIYINKLDTQNETLLFTTPITDYTADVKLIDLKTGNIIKRWELKNVGSTSFSEDNTAAAICLNMAQYGMNFFTNKTRLVLIDLANKKVDYEENIPCDELALSHSAEQRQIAISYKILTAESQLKSLLLFMNFNTNDGRIKIDAGCDRSISSLAYSPDDSILVVACAYGDMDGTIHFINPSDGTKIHSIEGYPGITNVAFSPDGKFLGVAFGGGIMSVLGVPVTPTP